MSYIYTNMTDLYILKIITILQLSLSYLATLGSPIFQFSENCAVVQAYKIVRARLGLTSILGII